MIKCKVADTQKRHVQRRATSKKGLRARSEIIPKAEILRKVTAKKKISKFTSTNRNSREIKVTDLQR
jgi:hypothetical protein